MIKVMFIWPIRQITESKCLSLLVAKAWGYTWISWGVAPGYINLAPLGLFGSHLSYFCFSKKKSNLFPS